jgi:hypothetical protein
VLLHVGLPPTYDGRLDLRGSFQRPWTRSTKQHRRRDSRHGVQHRSWQVNWQTLPTYQNICRAVVVKLSDGTASPAALFKFK